MSIRMDPASQRRDSSFGNTHAYNLGSPFQFSIDSLRHVRGSEPFPVLFRERRVTHEPGEESLDGIGRFPISSFVQIICKLLKSLLIPIGLLQGFSNFFQMFPVNIL